MGPMYNARKAAQVAARFTQLQGGTINVLKLAKLLYLAERAAVRDLDRPILNDTYASMDNGPVTSQTIRYVRNEVPNNDWAEYFRGRYRNDIALVRSELTRDDLDELSASEWAIIDGVWNEFGHMDRFVLADLTHKICPEWEDPYGSSYPIPITRMLNYLGKDVEAVEADLRERESIAIAMARD